MNIPKSPKNHQPDLFDSRLDKEHKEILAFIKSIQQCVNIQDQVGSLKEQVKKILPVILDHFSEEEQHMDSVGYPGSGAHILFHSSLLGDLAFAFETGEETNKESVALQINNLMQSLIAHFLNEDSKFDAFVAQLADTAEIQ